jgi:NADPH:quinone reductase-like Zn-dependent oxidoreductase
MKAVICRKYGGPGVFELTEVEQPSMKDNEILVRVRATSVTMSDIYIRSLRVPLYMQIPMRIMLGVFRPRNPINGLVLSGEVVETGKTTSRFEAGDEVYGLTGFSFGAYAEYKCMTERDSDRRGCIAIKPKSISHEEATSAAYGGLLGLQALEAGSVSEGSKILVYGASSTTGTMAIQMAKGLGAEVTGVCSSRNLELAKSLGADKVLDYTKDDSKSELENYSHVIDCVGKEKTSELRKEIERTQPKTTKFVSIDDGSLKLDSRRLDDIRDFIDSGKVKPVLDKTYPLEEIRIAHEFVAGGHKRGGVAITVG